MNKKAIILSISFIILIFLVTNSVLISSLSLIILLFIFIKQMKNYKDNKNVNLESVFFHSYYDAISQDNEVSIIDLYDSLKINLNNETLLPINKQSELDLLENMKIYFDDIYFNAFYHIKTNDNIKDKKKLLLCLMKKYFSNEKNIIQKNVKTEKNNDKNLKLLFICMLSITLIRFLFTKYFLIYSSSVIGICSLTLISIIAFMTYEKYLMSIFERKEHGKN